MSYKGNILKLPDTFLLGFSSSSYQVEGAASADGKGESIWDRFTHSPSSNIVDGSNGDVASDIHRHFMTDVDLLRNVGGQVYRFSISWSRLLPTGLANSLNPAGLAWYKLFINTLVESCIEPMVTLYHWDLPQPLQDLGGWANECMVDYFADFARICYENFGDRVKKWVTFNEPWEICHFGYGTGSHAPGVKQNGVAEYLAAHNLLKAHAKAYHLYYEEFRSKQQGVVGITLNNTWFEPKTEDPADVAATSRYRDFVVGWFANPIFSKSGDYPESMKKAVAENSKAEGFPKSRLPEFDDFWISYIRGTSDFYGLNYYTSQQISAAPPQKADAPTSWLKDAAALTSQPDSWPATAAPWFRVNPQGLRQVLNFVKQEYNNPEIYVLENGYADTGELRDNQRIIYVNDHLKELLKALYLDNVKVTMYTAWTFLDTFEWTGGYTQKFGVIAIDFNDPDRRRTPKKSAKYFQKVLDTRHVDK